MKRMPTLFISHGSPMLAIADSPARKFLLALGEMLPRPKSILVASAHWESIRSHKVSLATQPETIYDFGGFSDELYDMVYSAPGAPEVARRAQGLLENTGLSAVSSPNRGLDHGAWVPLSLMYPNADIPVTQVSILRGGTPAGHERMGRALAPLRDEGVLVVGSGSLTHNLSEFSGQIIDAPAPDWVREFADWMEKALNDNRREDLLGYRSRAPFAARNHPTEEHLLPLFVAMGAAGTGAKARRIHSSIEYGVLAMDVYSFEQT